MKCCHLWLSATTGAGGEGGAGQAGVQAAGAGVVAGGSSSKATGTIEADLPLPSAVHWTATLLADNPDRHNGLAESGVVVLPVSWKGGGETCSARQLPRRLFVRLVTPTLSKTVCEWAHCRIHLLKCEADGAVAGHHYQLGILAPVEHLQMTWPGVLRPPPRTFKYTNTFTNFVALSRPLPCRPTACPQ
jgi:hypothetical protein